MKTILLVYPHNIFLAGTGINRRYRGLLDYFRQRGFQVDMLSLENFEDSWETVADNKNMGIRHLYRVDFSAGNARRRAGRTLRTLFLKMKNPAQVTFRTFPDYTFPAMRKRCNKILEQNRYDYILISYPAWANLLKARIPARTQTVLDLSDFTSMKLFQITDGKVDLGELIPSEIKLVNRFDKVICISEEEQWFFSRFTTRPKFFRVPFFMPAPAPVADSKRSYHMIFTGSANHFNRQGMAWFFSRVYPLLRHPMRMVVVGGITGQLSPRENVDLAADIDDISALYNDTSIAVCPLRGGTGLKVKIVEALAHALPVVTTSHGLTGFSDKRQNGCIVADSAESFAASIERLLSNKSLYQTVSSQARAYFMNTFEKSAVIPVLDQVFN